MRKPRHGLERIYTDWNQNKRCPALEHDRIAGLNAGLAQALHAVEEFLLGIGQDVTGMEHGIHFFQELLCVLAGNPVTGVSAVIEDLCQQHWKPRSGLSLQVTQKAAQVSHPRDVAQGFGNKISLVLARFPQPLVVRFPFVLGGVAGQRRLASFVEGEAVGEGVCFGLAVANASAAYECIKAHGLLPSSPSRSSVCVLGCKSRRRGRPRYTFRATQSSHAVRIHQYLTGLACPRSEE